MKKPIDQLEERLQAIIEGSLARLFPSLRRPRDLGSQLVSAMRAHLHPQADGTVWAPNLYIIMLSPEQAAQIEDNWSLLDELSQMLADVGSEAGLAFLSPPVVKISSDPALEKAEMRVNAMFNRENMGDTSILAFDPTAPAADRENELPPNAFVIVAGKQAFVLHHSVVNIGRGPNNHLVIDDPRVSRDHAQLRAVHGRYFIFDLESTGGTFVNGRRISQAILRPGDVITMAGISLIYGQDTPPSGGTTQEISPFPDR